MPSKENKSILYQTEEGNVKVSVYFAEGNFWLTQKALGELFDVQKAAISKHLKNIYESGELKKRQLFPFWKQFKMKAAIFKKQLGLPV